MAESLPPPITRDASSVSIAPMARSIGLCVLLLLIYPAGSLAMRMLTGPSAPASQRQLKHQIDLANADLGELLLIPGLGETLAGRWIDERKMLLQKHSDPLKAIGEMRGIGPQKLKVIQQYAIAKTPPNQIKPASTTP